MQSSFASCVLTTDAKASIRTVVLALDADSNGSRQQAARRLSQRLRVPESLRVA
jgi:hypothetical protein